MGVNLDLSSRIMVVNPGLSGRIMVINPGLLNKVGMLIHVNPGI